MDAKIAFTITVMAVIAFSGCTGYDYAGMGNLRDESQPTQYSPVNELHGGAEALRKCNSLCNDFKLSGDDADAIKYGVQSVTMDLNKNGVINDRESGSFGSIQLPASYNEVCEEHIYCPMISGSECRTGQKALTMEVCRETLCSYFQKNGLTSEQATSKVSDLWETGECEINGRRNWADWLGIKGVFICGIQEICTDSDGGKDYYKQGIGQGYYNGKLSYIVETCVSDRENKMTVQESPFLAELFCTENGSLELEIYECPNGCRDGVCIE